MADLFYQIEWGSHILMATVLLYEEKTIYLVNIK